MRLSVKLFVAISLFLVPLSMSAQISKEQIKERKTIMKSSKSELNDKASKAARKEAKKLRKEGWTTAPGGSSFRQTT